MRRTRVVVVGNGMAAARLVDELVDRRATGRLEVVVFGDEKGGSYNRILLSDVLAGRHAPGDLWLRSESAYRRDGVVLHAGTRVVAIDRTRKVVFAERGIETPYDVLVLATGSAPFVPPLAGIRDARGALVPGVHVFRTLEDCAAIREAAGHAERAIVLGGGLLGLEAARGLLQMGLDVSVVHLAPHLMETQLDAGAGRILEARLARMGVRFFLEKKATSVAHVDDRLVGLDLADGARVAGDLLVVAAGARPNVSLAADAGLEVRSGIVVGDDLCTTRDPDVTAIGECAEHRGVTYGLVAPAWEQARVLAERLASPSAARYSGSRISTKLKVMGVDLAVMGRATEARPSDEIVHYAEATRGIYKRLVIRHGKLAAAIVLGDGAAAASLRQVFDRDDELPDDRAELLFALAPTTVKVRIEDLPDDARICNCNGVSKRDIVAAARAGCRTLAVLCERTRAATGCGTCKHDVATLLARELERAPASEAAE